MCLVDGRRLIQLADAVTLGQYRFAVLDDGNGEPWHLEFLHHARHVSVEVRWRTLSGGPYGAQEYSQGNSDSYQAWFCH